MPCLNEDATISACITKARRAITRLSLDAEILIADNGSRDKSVEIARSLGARVVDVAEKGYGNALLAGIRYAHGTYVIMADADDSYDFSDLDPFVQKLREGCHRRTQVPMMPIVVKQAELIAEYRSCIQC